MFILLTAVLILLDYSVKEVMLDALSDGISIPVIKNVYHLTLVKNTGMAFGLLQGYGYFFTAVPFLIIVLIVIFRKKIHENLFVKKFCLSCVVAGACGNMLDRIIHGAVIDYLDFRIWPVFNLADAIICIGFGGIVLCTLSYSRSGR